VTAWQAAPQPWSRTTGTDNVRFPRRVLRTSARASTRQGRHVIDAQPGKKDAPPLGHAQDHPAGGCVQLIVVAANDQDHRNRIHR